MATWFTSDHHFGHANIIRYTQRPYADVQEMDRCLIESWNAVVRPDDDIWCLGDFCYRSAKAAQTYLQRLHGRKHLICGNHDSEQTRQAAGWASSQAYAEISVDHRRLVLLHYAMRVWPGMRRNAIHLYGHSHGRLPGFRLPGFRLPGGGDNPGGCLDVGVDCWGYRPVSVAEIVRRIRTLEEMPEPEYGEDDA